MTQQVASLGEIGTPDAILTPLDLPLLRDGSAWDLTNYTNPRISIWDLRTKTAVASPGTISIQTAASGIVRYQPDPTNFTSGVYEARVTVENAGGDDEHSGLFRFSLGAGAQ